MRSLPAGLGVLPYLFGATGVLLGGFLGDWLTARTGSRRRGTGRHGHDRPAPGRDACGRQRAVSTLRSWRCCVCSLGYFFSYIQLAGLVGRHGRRGRPAPGGPVRPVQHDRPGGRRRVADLSRLFRRPHESDLATSGRAQWDPAFYLYGGVLMVGGMLWLFMDPKRTVVPADAVEE